MLIAFHGPAGSGKDACGAFLINRHGFKRASFATPIYDALEVLGFGRPTTQAEKDAVIPEFGVSWRFAAQTLGTEWGRNTINPLIWLTLLRRRVKDHPEDKLVLTDVRFENEAAMVRETGGVVVHLRGRRSVTTENTAHASEQPLEVHEGDVVLHNDTPGLDVLHDKLGIALRAWL